MNKLILIFFILLLGNVCIACDATIYPQKNYLVIAPFQIKTFKIENEVILSGQLMTSIFSEKNQLILKPKNIGKTKIFINDKVFLIEVSAEQKEEWNISDITCLEIDKPLLKEEERNKND